MGVDAERTDRAGYNDHYKENLSDLCDISSPEDYIRIYRETRIGPYYKSGNTKGYVRGLALNKLIADADRLVRPREDIEILDAGSGQGELSIYLACLGFNVVSVDISSEAKACGEYLASQVGVSNNCDFHDESLDKISVDDSSIDFVIGHASLHHFIKYEGVPGEFRRVLRDGGRGYFADSFGENRFYHLFHNKEQMRRLGDVTLTKNLIESYFRDFDLKITPTDWFIMLDKLYIKFLPRSWNPLVRNISRVNNWLDRKLPNESRFSLFLSGSVFTEITKRGA